MAEQMSWWIGVDRETFMRVAHDPVRLMKLQGAPGYIGQSGWAEERPVRRDVRSDDWTPPVDRRPQMHEAA